MAPSVDLEDLLERLEMLADEGESNLQRSVTAKDLAAEFPFARSTIAAHLADLADEGDLERTWTFIDGVGSKRAYLPADDESLESVEKPDPSPRLITDGGTDVFEDGQAVRCPDCGGELQYQDRAVAFCLECEATFSHYYSADRHELVTMVDDELETVATVERDDRELITDGGRPVPTIREHTGDEWANKANTAYQNGEIDDALLFAHYATVRADNGGDAR